MSRKSRSPASIAAILVAMLLTFAAGCGEKKEQPPSGIEQASPYPPGFVLEEVPDPLSGDNPLHTEPRLPLPQPGVPFEDGCFSTRIIRATVPDGINGRHEYSRFDPFNADKSMIMLVSDTGDYTVYRTGSFPYNRPENLVMTVAGLAEPRWDRGDPGKLWGLSDFGIARDDAATGEREMVKDFSTDPLLANVLAAEPDLYRITMKDEGEASADMRYWALMLQGTEDDYRPRYIFCWDRVQDKVLGLYRLEREESDIDWVGMSVKGNWVLIGGMESNSGNLAGLTMADRELKRFQRIDYTTSHADVGLDAAGNEVLVMQNSRTDYVDMLPLDPRTRPVTSEEEYAGSNRLRLVRLYYDSESPHGLNSGVHISCNAPGWCLVSTTIGPGQPERNWLDRSNILVRLDPAAPRAFYLCKTYNTTEEYWEETHGALSNDGSRVVWASNWNREVGEERVFLLQLDLPPGLALRARPRFFLTPFRRP